MKQSMIKGIILLKLATLFLGVSCTKGSNQGPVQIPSMPIEVPTEGNSWFLRNADTEQVQSFDFKNFDWSSTAVVLRTYFRVEKAGKIDIGIRCRVTGGTTELQSTFNKQSKNIVLKNTTKSVVYIQSVDVPSPGYYYIDLKGVKKSEEVFAQIDAVMLGGSATSSGVNAVGEEYFYWGRRGPSVHLSYEVPAGASDILYFYNEITVPTGNDVIGSYFMANGFAEGYFGFQVNSATERRVLFSVWSPYQTDNPNDIPADQRVLLLAKGSGVTTNDFGNEGSGGQSYLVYNWQAGNTYRFLLKGQPAGNDKTNYTAYFYAPEAGVWKLIASWQRPKTNTYLKRPHSFLENFVTHTGPIVRKAYYNNQWIYDTNGKWHELTVAKFTADQTAMTKNRMDYAGGIADGTNGFYMKNCGFFSDFTQTGSLHTRVAKGTEPQIDFNTFPAN
jgi:hypothetical protein